MTRSDLLLCGFTAVLVVAIGCSAGGGTDSVTSGPPPPSAQTQMTLIANPAGALIGQPITFTVTASSTQKVLESASIDYQSDGGWDDKNTENQSSFETTFSHAYANPGTYAVRAEVLDEDQASTTRTTTVSVVAPANRPISVLVRGLAFSGADSLPTCVAVGPPIACDGCIQAVDPAGTRISLGTLPSGTPVSVTQAFKQKPTYDYTTAVDQDIPYSCYFDVSIFAGTAGSDVLIGSGYCTTEPAILTCSITANGTVP